MKNLRSSTFRLLVFLIVLVLIVGILYSVFKSENTRKPDSEDTDTTVVCKHSESDLTNWIYYTNFKHIKNCKKCGELQVKIQGHVYVNGICECGAEEPEVDDTGSSGCTHNGTYEWKHYSYLYHAKKCNKCKEFFGSMGAHTYDSSFNCTVCGAHCDHFMQTTGDCRYCGETISSAPAQIYTLTITYLLEENDGSLVVYDVETFEVEAGVPYYIEYPDLKSMGYRTSNWLLNGVYTIEFDSAYQVVYTRTDMAQPL